MPIPNFIEIHQKIRDILIIYPARWYIIALVGQMHWLFPSLLPLTTLFNPAIQICDRILVHPILVDDEDLIINSLEEISGMFTLTC